ncbi:9173_t:CDS:2 [Gigaspora margarita]|uniref:9173_t:CDS:1 n=1 Tax=Gigaspora margarita TaxID=4874 RepID=A0ABN7X353_GIGMA|nr:9173_t:CDS:2 [Gigaspora margarita]
MATRSQTFEEKEVLDLSPNYSNDIVLDVAKRENETKDKKPDFPFLIKLSESNKKFFNTELEQSRSGLSLRMKTRNLKVYREEENLIENVGSFGTENTSVSDIRGIVVSDRLLTLFLGFKLDPNFTFKANFAYYGISFDLLEHPLSDDTSKEIKDLKELINNFANREGTETKEKLERICQLVEDNQVYKNYKKKLNDRQLIELQERIQSLEIENERLKNQNKFLSEQLESVAQVEILPK